MSTTNTISLQRNLSKKRVIPRAVATDYAVIKKLIWAYFLLLLFEGALRKWFLPGLSQGLLIIRDPLVILIYYLSYTKGVFPLNNKYLKKVPAVGRTFNCHFISFNKGSHLYHHLWCSHKPTAFPTYFHLGTDSRME